MAFKFFIKQCKIYITDPLKPAQLNNFFYFSHVTNNNIHKHYACPRTNKQ